MRINGTVFADQALAGGLNYFTVRTLLDIRPSATRDPNEASQKRLDRLVQVVSTRAQPTIVGQVRVSVEDAASITDIPAAAALSGNVNVYVFRFAIDHHLAWDADALAETLDGIEGFVHTTPTIGNNVAIVRETEF